MSLNYSVRLDQWNGEKLGYVTNFYTTRISIFSTGKLPEPVRTISTALSMFHEYNKHKFIHIVVPGTAPNALHVVKRLTDLQSGSVKPNLKLKIKLIEGPNETIRIADFMGELIVFDVQFQGFVPTNSRINHPGGGISDDDSMTARFGSSTSKK